MSQSKLQKLDAQTTSNQKQSSGIMSAVDIFNKYGDQVVYEYLKDNPEVNAELGDQLKDQQMMLVNLRLKQERLIRLPER